MRNLNLDMKLIWQIEVNFFCLQFDLDASKRIEKIIRENSFKSKREINLD